jgi:hypothetical protein
VELANRQPLTAEKTAAARRTEQQAEENTATGVAEP